MRIDAVVTQPVIHRCVRRPAFARLTGTATLVALTCAWGPGSSPASADVLDATPLSVSEFDTRFETINIGMTQPGILWVTRGRLTVDGTVYMGSMAVPDYFGGNPYQPDDRPDETVHLLVLDGTLATDGGVRSFTNDAWVHLAGGTVEGKNGTLISAGRVFVYDNLLFGRTEATRYAFGPGDEILTQRLAVSPTLPSRMRLPLYPTPYGSGAPMGAGYLSVTAGASVFAVSIRVGETANRVGAFEQQGGRITTSHIDNWSTYRWSGGTLVFDGGLFTNQGTYEQSTGTLRLGAGLAHVNTGRMNLRGTATLQLDALAHLSGNGVIDSEGTVTGAGVIEGGILNRGTVEATGEMAIGNGLDNGAAGKVTVGAGARLEVGLGLANAGLVTVDRGTLIVQGPTTNTGEIRVQSGSASFNGRFEHLGIYRSDASTQYFADLLVGDTGVIVAGAGDRFRIRNDFLNLSTQSTTWDTDAATLELLAGHAHQLTLAGIDRGAHIDAFENNFAWGELMIGANAAVTFQGQGDGTPRALYVHALQLAGGLNAVADLYSDSVIYYDQSLAANAYLGGRSYQLAGGGMLVASVPEASTVTMTGVGLAALGALAWRRRLAQLAAA